MNKLKELRKLHNVSQEELSKKLSVTEKTISRWENEKTQIKPDKAQKLAEYFNVSVAYLLGYIDTPKEELMTFDSGEEFEKARQKISNTPAQGDEITLIYGKGNELKNVKVKEISLQDSYKKIAANLAGSLSDINNEKWLEYGTLLLKSEKENS
ncbi:helix-turn-helix transcriptional regulator [Pseudolactococcus raffinolactis]|uniref:helix-turn-helix domain-containing protein n=1 Tax=Pseudolactococcus raffinolactis TaxID=1366 RepID=UPI0014371559|nr:helix-turn-helix transcriptional regulator [Lactococcus raffinolactis]QIW56169.1 helix-turn-helix transcriptional regulator [Lactococcus raffinolactis]